jgi:ABC-type phosphate transport system permease subunit
VQTVSGESLSEIGVSQKSDIILKPNYSLIAAIGLILLFSTMIVMVLIFYCLHKDWKINDVDNNRTFRDE